MIYEAFESKIEDLFAQLQPQITVWDMRVNPEMESDLAQANGLLNMGSTLALLGGVNTSELQNQIDNSNSMRENNVGRFH